MASDTIYHFADVHTDRRAFVIGSGPSLNAQNLAPLADEITFTCNRGHLLFPRIGGPSTYWCVEDVLDVQQWGNEFRNLRGTVKFVPEDVGELGEGSVLTPFIRERFDATRGPKFSLEPPFMWGATVSYLMIQLASYMGCNPIYLLGHDFTYDTRKIARYSNDGVWRNEGRDTDHFDPDYWPDGSIAFAADLPRMRAAFMAARTAVEAIGGRIVNLTPNTKLDVFDRGELSEVVGR